MDLVAFIGCSGLPPKTLDNPEKLGGLVSMSQASIT